MGDPIREVRELLGPMPPNGWQYYGHTIYIQTHARLEFAHPLLRRFAPLLSPDWDCLVDGKLVGLFFASPVYAKHNGTAFILKQMMSQEGQTMKLPEEEQAIRPKLHRYKLKERSVEIFLTEKDHPSEPQGWTCLLTGNWWGLGFEVAVRRNRTLSFMLRNRLESLRGCESERLRMGGVL